MISVSDLPAVNATLNAVSALLIATGYYCIRRGDRRTHQRVMLAAFFVSTLFLISYLTYHFQVGSVRFRGTGALRVAYLSVLPAPPDRTLDVAAVVLCLRHRRCHLLDAVSFVGVVGHARPGNRNARIVHH